MTQEEVKRKFRLSRRLFELVEEDSNDYALIHHYCHLMGKYQELYNFSFSHPLHFSACLFP